MARAQTAAPFRSPTHTRICEAEDLFIDGHDVQHQIVGRPPTAQRRSGCPVFLEPELTNSFAEPMILGSRRHLHDHVDIGRMTDANRRRIRHEQLRNVPADEYHFGQERSCALRHAFQQESVRTGRRHSLFRPADARMISSCFAACVRSRAWPTRNASTRVNAWYSGWLWQCNAGAPGNNGTSAAPRTLPLALGQTTDCLRLPRHTTRYRHTPTHTNTHQQPTVSPTVGGQDHSGR